MGRSVEKAGHSVTVLHYPGSIGTCLKGSESSPKGRTPREYCCNHRRSGRAGLKMQMVNDKPAVQGGNTRQVLLICLIYNYYIRHIWEQNALQDRKFF